MLNSNSVAGARDWDGTEYQISTNDLFLNMQCVGQTKPYFKLLSEDNQTIRYAALTLDVYL